MKQQRRAPGGRTSGLQQRCPRCLARHTARHTARRMSRPGHKDKRGTVGDWMIKEANGVTRRESRCSLHVMEDAVQRVRHCNLVLHGPVAAIDVFHAMWRSARGAAVILLHGMTGYEVPALVRRGEPLKYQAGLDYRRSVARRVEGKEGQLSCTVDRGGWPSGLWVYMTRLSPSRWALRLLESSPLSNNTARLPDSSPSLSGRCHGLRGFGLPSSLSASSLRSSTSAEAVCSLESRRFQQRARETYGRCTEYQRERSTRKL